VADDALPLSYFRITISKTLSEPHPPVADCLK